MKRYFFFAITLLLAACRHDDKHPDISKVKVDLTMERFEQSFYRMDSNQIAAGLTNLRNSFPGFYGFYMNELVGINPADSNGQKVVRLMLHDYGPINDSLQRQYRDLGWLQNELTTGFRYVKYYYPDFPTPRIATFVGPLDAPGALMSYPYLGIGLHLFAGKDFSVYQDQAVRQLYPEYISRRFSKEYITAQCMTVTARELYPDQSTGKPLLDQIIEKGKQWYLLDHFLPDAPDSVKTGFTGAQLAWLKENEGNVWGFLLGNENLYSIEPSTLQTYLGEAPFTQGLPDAAPGNIGPWVGWQIIKKYAEKKGFPPVKQLLATPAKTIYEESKYKPK
jgi:hypothetical protein